jgi:hypothetical protein
MKLKIERIPSIKEYNITFHKGGTYTTETTEFWGVETIITMSFGRWSKIWKWKKGKK